MTYKFFVYILTNFNRTVLYIGITSDLQKRIREHRLGKGSKFTAKYNLKYVIYFEEFCDVYEAIQREKDLKSKSRQKKEAIINQFNPNWDDLSSSIS